MGLIALILNPKVIGYTIILAGVLDWAIWINFDYLMFNPFVAMMLVTMGPFYVWMGHVQDKDKDNE